MSEQEQLHRDIAKLEDRMNRLETAVAEQNGTSKAWQGEVLRRLEESGRDRTQFRIDLADAVGRVENLFASAVTRTETTIERIRTEMWTEITRIQTESREENKAIQTWANKVVISSLSTIVTLILTGVVSAVVFYITRGPGTIR